MTYRPWSKPNEDYLKRHAGKKKASAIARYLRRSEGSVRQKARGMGLSLDTRV